MHKNKTNPNYDVILHLAAHGFFNQSLLWKAMATFSNNFGKYKSKTASTYDPTRKQLSSLVQLSWQLKNKPIAFSGSFAADYGSLHDQGQSAARFGSQFSVSWKIK